MKPPKTACKFKCQRKFNKGTTRGYRTQQASKISPGYGHILTKFTSFNSKKRDKT